MVPWTYKLLRSLSYNLYPYMSQPHMPAMYGRYMWLASFPGSSSPFLTFSCRRILYRKKFEFRRGKAWYGPPPTPMASHGHGIDIILRVLGLETVFFWGGGGIANCAVTEQVSIKASTYWSLPSNKSVYYHGWQRYDILHHLCEQISQNC